MRTPLGSTSSLDELSYEVVSRRFSTSESESVASVSLDGFTEDGHEDEDDEVASVAVTNVTETDDEDTPFTDEEGDEDGESGLEHDSDASSDTESEHDVDPDDAPITTRRAVPVSDRFLAAAQDRYGPLVSPTLRFSRFKRPYPGHAENPYRILYIGPSDTETCRSLVARIGSALATQHHRGRDAEPSIRFNVVPISEFGNPDVPPIIELLESGIQIEVSLFRGADSFRFGRDIVYSSIETSRGATGRRADFFFRGATSYRPRVELSFDLVVFVHPLPRTVEHYPSLRREFQWAGIPVLDVTTQPVPLPAKYSFRPYEMRLSLDVKSADGRRTTIGDVPVDIDNFLDLDPRKLRGHLNLIAYAAQEDQGPFFTGVLHGYRRTIRAVSQPITRQLGRVCRAAGTGLVQVGRCVKTVWTSFPEEDWRPVVLSILVTVLAILLTTFLPTLLYPSHDVSHLPQPRVYQPPVVPEPMQQPSAATADLWPLATPAAKARLSPVPERVPAELWDDVQVIVHKADISKACELPHFRITLRRPRGPGDLSRKPVPFFLMTIDGKCAITVDPSEGHGDIEVRATHSSARFLATSTVSFDEPQKGLPGWVRHVTDLAVRIPVDYRKQLGRQHAHAQQVAKHATRRIAQAVTGAAAEVEDRFQVAKRELTHVLVAAGREVAERARDPGALALRALTPQTIDAAAQAQRVRNAVDVGARWTWAGVRRGWGEVATTEWAQGALAARERASRNAKRLVSGVMGGSGGKDGKVECGGRRCGREWGKKVFFKE